MTKYSLSCEVLTPLFLGGADARGAPPELRPPSFRGAMRFWYRALVGGSSLMESSDRLKTLHQKEADVFGATERGSAISIRISSVTESIDAYKKDRAIQTPQGGYLPTGKDYLFWSMSSTGKPGTPRFQPARSYIQPGTKFDLVLGAHLQPENLNKGLAAFWLLSNLGGLGSRSNRTAGSFQATGQDIPLQFESCSSINNLKSHLVNGIKNCLDIVTEHQPGWMEYLPSEQPEYESLHPNFSVTWIVSRDIQGWGTYQDAVNGLGEKFRDYRSHANPNGKADHDAVLEWFNHGQRHAPDLKRPVFGLPIPFRYSDGGPSDVIISSKSDRRGSPLHMRVTRLSTGRYVGVLTLFKSKFLPDTAKLRLQERKWDAPAPSDYQFIEDFIQTFGTKEKVQL